MRENFIHAAEQPSVYFDEVAYDKKLEMMTKAICRDIAMAGFKSRYNDIVDHIVELIEDEMKKELEDE